MKPRMIVVALIFKAVVLTFKPFRDDGEGDFNVLATSVPIFKMLRRLDKLLWVRGEEPPYPKEEYFKQRASRVFMERPDGKIRQALVEGEEKASRVIDRSFRHQAQGATPP